MAQQSSKKRATYADVLAAPENVVAEVIDGVLTAMPRPAPRHARASTRLGGQLDGPFDSGKGGPGGWILLFEPELHLGNASDPDILVPDLAGWRRERMPELPGEAFFRLAPDWCCEVLSPGTRRHDRVLKIPIYARERVGHVWMIDPSARTLEVLRFEGDGYRIVKTFGGEDAVRAEPFDAVPIELGALWDAAPPGEGE